MEMKDQNRSKKLFYKTHAKSTQSIVHELKDLGIYLVFLLVTTIVAISSREIGMFYFNSTIERLFHNRFTSNQYGLELAYEDLVTIADWWSFAETTFIEGITQFEINLLSQNESAGGKVLLGPPRLRQIRVKNEPCKINRIFQNEFKNCFGQYTKSKEDLTRFLNKEHSSQTQANTYGVSGLITNYHGAGYIEILDFDKEENENILAELKNSSWIDSATRIILIEFLLFNSNVNLFCNVKFLAEISPTGGVVTSNQFQTLKYFPLWNDGGYFVMLCSFVFFGLILYYTIEMSRDAISKGFQMINESFFNILRILVLLIAYATIIYIPWHTFYLKSTLKKYEEGLIQFISLDIICYWNGIFIDLMGTCVFIVWIQIFEYIKFNKTMMQFSITLQRCSKDLLGFGIMFAIVFVAFALMAVMIFGSVHSGFCNFSTSILTLVRTVLGDFDFEKLEAANRILGPIFFVCFILFVFFILMNMFLAIINDTYIDVKSEKIERKENQFEEYIKSLVEKIKKRIFPGSKKKADRKSDDDEEPQVSRTSNIKQMSYEDQQIENIDTIIERYFEVISTDRGDADEDPLTVRVTLLEGKLENIISNLNEILLKEDEKI